MTANKKQDLTSDFRNLQGEVEALDKRGCEILIEAIEDGLKAGDFKRDDSWSYGQADFVLSYLKTLVQSHANNNGWGLQP